MKPRGDATPVKKYPTPKGMRYEPTPYGPMPKAKTKLKGKFKKAFYA